MFSIPILTTFLSTEVMNRLLSISLYISFLYFIYVTYSQQKVIFVNNSLSKNILLTFR